MKNTALSPDFLDNFHTLVGWVCNIFDVDPTPIKASITNKMTEEEVLAFFDVVVDSRPHALMGIDTFTDTLYCDETGELNGLVFAFNDGMYEFSVESSDNGLMLNGDGFAIADMYAPHNLIDRKRLEAMLPEASQQIMNLILRAIETLPLPKNSEAEGIARCITAELRQYLMPEKARVSRDLAPHLMTCCQVLDRLFGRDTKLQTAMEQMLQSLGNRPMSNKTVLWAFRDLCEDSGVLTLDFDYSHKTKNIEGISVWFNLPGYDNVELFVCEKGLVVHGDFFLMDTEENFFGLDRDTLYALLKPSGDPNVDAAFRHSMEELLASVRPLLVSKESRALFYDILRLLRSTAKVVVAAAA